MTERDEEREERIEMEIIRGKENTRVFRPVSYPYVRGTPDERVRR